MVWNHDSESWLQLLRLFFRRRILIHHLVDVQNCQRLDLSGLTRLVNFLRNVDMLPITLEQILQVEWFPDKPLSRRGRQRPIRHSGGLLLLLHRFRYKLFSDLRRGPSIFLRWLWRRSGLGLQLGWLVLLLVRRRLVPFLWTLLSFSA